MDASLFMTASNELRPANLRSSSDSSNRYRSSQNRVANTRVTNLPFDRWQYSTNQQQPFAFFLELTFFFDDFLDPTMQPQDLSSGNKESSKKSSKKKVSSKKKA